MKLHSPLWLDSIEDHYRRRANAAQRLNRWLTGVALALGAYLVYWLATI